MDRRLFAAYYDMRNDDYYTVVMSKKGFYTIAKINKKTGMWKIIKLEDMSYACVERNAIDAEGVLIRYLGELGLPVEKFNYVAGFFKDQDRMCLPLVKIKYFDGKRR